MAYTLVIVSGAGTYNFDVQPRFKPKLDNEIDTSAVPAIITGRVETYVLEGAAFRSATQSSVTGDFASLKSITGVALTSVTFRRGSDTVYEMTPATHVGGVFCQTLETSGDDGEFATFWKGTLVIWGREVFPTYGGGGTGLSALEEELEYDYDEAGLTRITSRGTLETLPGTSAEAKARTHALESPGEAFGLVTAGPSDAASVRVLDSTDTKASWTSIWQEHGESLPAGVNKWKRQIRTSESGDAGATRTVTVSAKGPTLTSLREAVRAEAKAEDLVSFEETEDPTALEFSATYSEAIPSTKRPLGAGIVSDRLDVDVQGCNYGEARDVTAYPISGYPPFFVPQPRQPITVTERRTKRYRGAAVTAEIESALSSVSGLRLQPGRSSTPPPRLVERGLSDTVDLWEGTATYVYLATEVNVTALFNAVKEVVK